MVSGTCFLLCTCWVQHVKAKFSAWWVIQLHDFLISFLSAKVERVQAQRYWRMLWRFVWGIPCILRFCEQSFVNLLSLDWQLLVFRLLVLWECCIHPALWMLVCRWSTYQALGRLICQLSFWLNGGSAILRWRCAMPRKLDSRQLSSTTTRMTMS